MRSGGDPRPLVIGYGSLLRTDDGIGWRVAERLAQDPRLDGVTVLQRHQLTPELALDVSRASLVAFVDAGMGGAPGSVVIEPIARSSPGTTAWTHRFDPPTLVALAHALYGVAPDAYAVRVSVGSLEAGTSLTPALDRALPHAVDAVAGLIARERPTVGAGP